MHIEMSLTAGLKNYHITWGRIKDQTKFMKNKLATLTISHCKCSAPTLVTGIPMSLGASTDIENKVAVRICRKRIIARQKVAVYLDLIVRAREVIKYLPIKIRINC